MFYQLIREREPWFYLSSYEPEDIGSRRERLITRSSKLPLDIRNRNYGVNTQPILLAQILIT